MRTWIIRIVGVTTLCALSFGMGVFAQTTGPDGTDVYADLDELDFGADRADWRQRLPELRGSADGDILREIALESIELADNDVALSEAIQVLGWVGVDEDADLLFALVDEGTGTPSSEAIVALGHLGTPRAVDALLELHDRRDSTTQDAVIRALGSTGSDRALSVLSKDVEHPTWESAAAGGLANHGTTQAARILVRRFESEDTRAHWALSYALASFSPEAVPAARTSLRRGLRSGNSDRRSSSMQALARVGDEGIYDALLDASRSPNVTVQQQAIQGLGTLQDERALPRLEDIARTGSQQVRSSAVYAIGAIGGDAGNESLITLVEIGSLDVGAAAANAFQDLGDEGVIDVLMWAVENRGTQVADASRNRMFNGPWAEGTVPPELFELAHDAIERRGSNGWSGQAYSFLLQHGGEDDQEFILDILENGSAQQKS
ncbi:MAG: HEAT repeat domain-containing protein, partial [Proteobacteria bacterium]|nr:HEAT repeat domain-containing protein [Pseudomonadota bacterium]